MKASLRLLVLCLLGGICGVLCGPASVIAGETSPPGDSASLLGNPLTVPTNETLVGGGQQAAEEARLTNPEAVAERAASRTRFAGLGREGAVALAKSTFGVQRPVWTAPGGAGEGKITGYLGSNTADELSPSGKHLVVESSVPLLSSVGSGQSAPTSLALREDGGAFVPANPVVPVSISRVPANGVSLPAGVSVAPQQAATPEAPVTVGDQVLYPDTATDTDFMVQPVPAGVETSWQLLSEDSSQENSLVFKLPAGASLQLSDDGGGGAEIVDEGQVLTLIRPATATEADGTSLPVSYSVSGDVLTTHVDLEGSVAFPVMVDPSLIVGLYGAYSGGSGTWPGWEFYTNCATGCYGHEERSNLLWMALFGPNSWPSGDYGEWYIYAPDSGEVDGASIERVDMYDLTHESGESYMRAEIGPEAGPHPIYTFNGTDAEDTREAPYRSTATFVNDDMTLCDSGTGKGYDGGAEHLCKEEHGSKYFSLRDEMLGAATYYNWIEVEGIAVTYLDPVPPTEVYLHGIPNSGWVKYGPSSTYISAQDRGTGIAKLSVEVPAGYENEKKEVFFSEKSSCSERAGYYGCPKSAKSSSINFSSLPTGKYVLGVYAESAALSKREEEIGPYGEERHDMEDDLENPEDKYPIVYPTLYVDHTPPTLAAFGGSLSEASGAEIGNGDYTLTFGGEDGTVEAPQSGVHSLTVYVDGSKVDEVVTSCPEPTGVPASGCFGLTGSWTMEGAKYGAGLHTITVTAKDWMGNEASRSMEVTVNEAAYEPTGPGAVNLKTGAFKLEAADVTVASAGADLTVGRSYNSRELSQGAEGPLGSQWSLSLPDSSAEGVWQSLRAMPDGNVEATLANGTVVTFAPNGSGGFVSPAGYQTMTLTEPSKSPLEYQISTTAGDATIFKRASSEEEEAPLLVPSGVVQATGAGGLNKVTYEFTKTGEGITEPTEVIAPYPSSIKCLTELVKGCRALEFKYATSTSATGEHEKQWGSYKGRLKEVKLVAWNPATGEKEMQTKTIAEYEYDHQGRLRAEWNPRISPELKTKYGYDAEGHVTALTLPGQETWAFTYGTISNDSDTGRLLKVMQASASTSLWNGEQSENTEVPVLSGSPVAGVRMAVSNGKWSNGPVAYTYQWEDCNSSGKECTPILGANDPNYTPVASDVGHTLVAQVSAINGDGSVTTASSASSEVKYPVVSEYGLPSGSGPKMITTGQDGNLWFTNEGTNKIGKITTTGSVTEYSLPAGSKPNGIALGSDGNIWFTEYGTSKIGKITTAGSITEYSLPSESIVKTITSGPDGDLWFTEEGTRKIGKITTGGSITEYSVPENKTPCRIVGGPENALWFTERTASKIGRVTTSGSFTEYSLPAGSEPTGIVPGPDGDLWFADYATNKVGKLTTTGSIREYSVEAGSGLFNIASGPDGALWFAERTSNKIGRITTTGTIIEYSLPSGSEPYGIVPGPDSNLWFTNSGTNKVGTIKIDQPAGEAQPPQPGTTLQYNVSLSGTESRPTMTKEEVERWGQAADPPAEATAVFPASEPQEWPAASYQKATIYYLDSNEHTVNVATPAGGVTTAEYEKYGNTIRTLSADNRATALSEGSKSVEVAKELSTESKYADEGRELEETLGPEHKVKLPSGSEVQARKQVKYEYEEGAPSGGPYLLVTKTTEDALTAGKKEDMRTSADSYSGQENLGWKLHEPTSVTVAPGGLNLTHKMQYSSTTGAEIETQMPLASSGVGPAPLYSSQFGSYGSGNGELFDPRELVLNGKGDMFVADEENNRIEEFTEKGEFVKNIGSVGSGNGELQEPKGVALDSKNNIWVADTNNNRIEEFNEKGEYVRAVGTVGDENGQFKEPKSIAINSHNDVFVADSGNNRVEEFNEKGEFIKTIGSAGTGSGEMEDPRALAIAPNGSLWVADTNNNRIEEFNEKGEYVTVKGSLGTGNGQFKEPKGITVDSHGNVWVVDTENGRVQEFNEKGEYELQFGSGGIGNGEFKEPWGIAVNTQGEVFVADGENNRIQKFVTPNTLAHDSQVIYYTPGTEASVVPCQDHPEWANLPCQTQPVHQPETPGMPELPITITTYNIWDEPETTKSISGEATRSETDGYDSAGRLTSKETTSTTGSALPKVSYQYSTETGLLVKQSTGSGGSEQKITSEYNKLGQLASYTDAAGKTTVYEYEKEKESRLKKVTDEKGYQSFEYSEATGLMSSLRDSVAGLFTATYDAEGNLISEGLPNGMSATTTRNSVGEPTSLEYTKTTHCSENCKWFSDSIVPSIHEQWMSQASTLSTNTYTYDEAGRLAKVQDTPVGKGCATRIYAYDADGNITSLTKRAPASGGGCATEGGEVEAHRYDTADRLIDPGTSYNPFGDITGLPGADAGGSEMTSSYYADGQLQSQTQAGQTIGYDLDPARRTSETISTGKIISDVTDNYDGPGSTPSWMSYTSGEWTRNIAGLDGSLAAVQLNNETPVLQLANLHGDIIATVPDSETATKLTSAIDTTEYGVPSTAEPPKYSWLGAGDFPTELASGVMAMGARSYVPQLGRFLQPDPQPGGSANAYSYTHGNPLNESDPSGEFTEEVSYGGLNAVGEGEGVHLENGVGYGAGAILPAPVNVQAEEAFWADPPWDQVTAGTEEYEEYEEEGEEYAAYHQGAGSGYEKAQVESGLLFEPLHNEGGEGGESAIPDLPLCKMGIKGPCISFVGCFPNLISCAKKAIHWVEKNVIKPAEHWIHDTYCETVELVQFMAEHSEKGEAMLHNGYKPRHFKGCPNH